MLRWWVLLGGLVVACASACDTSAEEKTAEACASLCKCEAPPLPGLQTRCQDQCAQEVDTSQLPDQCLACITANSQTPATCARIQDVCGPVCNPEPPVDVLDAGVTPL